MFYHAILFPVHPRSVVQVRRLLAGRKTLYLYFFVSGIAPTRGEGKNIDEFRWKDNDKFRE